MTVRLEFKPQDCWIGAFWKPGHVWVCLLPMLPIHFALDQKGGDHG